MLPFFAPLTSNHFVSTRAIISHMLLHPAKRFARSRSPSRVSTIEATCWASILKIVNFFILRDISQKNTFSRTGKIQSDSEKDLNYYQAIMCSPGVIHYPRFDYVSRFVNFVNIGYISRKRARKKGPPSNRPLPSCPDPHAPKMVQRRAARRFLHNERAAPRAQDSIAIRSYIGSACAKG